MKKLIYNKTVLVFLNTYDLINFKKNDLKDLKSDFLKKYDNCIIYNYFDILNNKDIIRDKINKLKFENQRHVHARECKICVIEKEEKNDFLNKNHIQNTDKSQIYYGAFHHNELVAVMTFDIKKGVNGGIEDGVYDLSRFSIKLGCVITGIFNKILKKFINDYSPNKIISFADLNQVNRFNNIYEYNGFKLSKCLPPSYKVYKKSVDKLYHKITFGTKFIKEKNLNKSKIEALNNDLIKVWDCGKLKYELFINENKEIVFGFIYKIKNKINGKVYIGQTTRNLNKRIYEYKSAFNLNKFYNEYLLRAFNKYGWENFEFSIIDNAATLEELNLKEIKYIQEYQSNDKKKGYNREVGGRNSIPTADTLEKMSRSHLGLKQTDAWIDKRIATAGTPEAKKYGRKKTEEDKKYLSEVSPKYWLGKQRDEKTKEKISQTKKERGLSDKQKKMLYKTVYLRDPRTNQVIRSFETTQLASVEIGVNQSTISRWCAGNKIKKGVMYTYI
jgi:group I intron endonuclease